MFAFFGLFVVCVFVGLLLLCAFVGRFYVVFW